MEKRALLAAALMALVLMVYQLYFVPPPPVSEKPPETKSAEPKPAVQPTPTPSARPLAAPAVKAPPPPSSPRPPQRTADVEAPLYRAVLSSEGAKLQQWTLHYRGEKPMVIVGELGPSGLIVGSGQAGEVVPMALSGDRLVLGPRQPPGELALEGEAAGLRVTQTLKFNADTFSFVASVRVENPGLAARPATVAVPWEYRHHPKMAPEAFTGQRPTEIVWSSGGHVERLEDLSSLGARVVDGQWIALGSTWYLAALMPRRGGFQLAMGSEAARGEGKNGEYRVSVAVQATPTIGPREAWEGEVAFYIGPKEYDRLAAFNLEGTLNFGGFPIPRRYGGLPMEWLGVPILRLMNWVYRYVGNYGVAIILLTVVSKLLFYPLTVKSIRSMRAMQALQPQVNALRSKYKNDPRKLQEETLALYRKYKVNPMGGCLPMIAQIPIFYALYLALSVSVELQNAPFLCFGRIWGVDLWICDLASHDPTYVLPILMGVSMFVQQKMSPTTGDPRQAKMMLAMPVIFTFMFLNLPSGLVLYWTVSNLLQILQQWYMERSNTRGAPGDARDAARA